MTAAGLLLAMLAMSAVLLFAGAMVEQVTFVAAGMAVAAAAACWGVVIVWRSRSRVRARAHAWLPAAREVTYVGHDGQPATRTSRILPARTVTLVVVVGAVGVGLFTPA